MSAPNTVTTTVYAGGGSPQVVGASATDYVSFFGTSAVQQQTNVATVTTTGATSTTNAYGYTTAAQADAIVTAINSILTRLQNLGLFASS